MIGTQDDINLSTKESQIVILGSTTTVPISGWRSLSECLAPFRWGEPSLPPLIPVALDGFIICLVFQGRTWKSALASYSSFSFHHVQWFAKFNILHPRDISWFYLILSNHTTFPLIHSQFSWLLCAPPPLHVFVYADSLLLEISCVCPPFSLPGKFLMIQLKSCSHSSPWERNLQKSILRKSLLQSLAHQSPPAPSSSLSLWQRVSPTYICSPTSSPASVFQEMLLIYCKFWCSFHSRLSFLNINYQN